MAKEKQSPQEKSVRKARDKSESFKRLATKRTNKALNAINGLVALTNPASYSYDTAQASRIIKVLSDAVSELASNFARPSAKARESFTL